MPFCTTQAAVAMASYLHKIVAMVVLQPRLSPGTHSTRSQTPGTASRLSPILWSSSLRAQALLASSTLCNAPALPPSSSWWLVHAGPAAETAQKTPNGGRLSQLSSAPSSSTHRPGTGRRGHPSECRGNGVLVALQQTSSSLQAVVGGTGTSHCPSLQRCMTQRLGNG